MFSRSQARRALFAVAVSFAAFSSVHADDRVPHNAFLAVQAAKDPSHFDPHLPAAQRAADSSAAAAPHCAVPAHPAG